MFGCRLKWNIGRKRRFEKYLTTLIYRLWPGDSKLRAFFLSDLQTPDNICQ